MGAGTARPVTSLKTAWTKVRDEAKVVGRWHDNRHTLVTELAESDAGDEVIMSITGHVSRAMLSRYSHVWMEANRRALDEIAARQRAADEKRNQAPPISGHGPLVGIFVGAGPEFRPRCPCSASSPALRPLVFQNFFETCSARCRIVSPLTSACSARSVMKVCRASCQRPEIPASPRSVPASAPGRSQATGPRAPALVTGVHFPRLRLLERLQFSQAAPVTSLRCARSSSGTTTATQGVSGELILARHSVVPAVPDRKVNSFSKVPSVRFSARRTNR
jgi:hypothetical protein